MKANPKGKTSSPAPSKQSERGVKDEGKPEGENFIARSKTKSAFKRFLSWSIYTTKSEPILNEIDWLPRRRRGRNSAKNCGGQAKRKEF